MNYDLATRFSFSLNKPRLITKSMSHH